MLQNHKQQLGLMAEDEALGLGMMAGLLSTNPNSNGLASFLPHHFDSGPHGNSHHFAAGCLLPCSIRSFGEDADEEEEENNNSSSVLCDILSLHQASNPWEWRCSKETMGMMEGDNESAEEDYDDTERKKMRTSMGLGVSNSGVEMEKKMKMKMKTRRKVREPRFSFKTLSDVDVLDDGYKWRKYGQKVVKNTQHPRSYYRCTQEKCRVKKKVERLAEDPRMVITTYEGRHSHSPAPLQLEDDHCSDTTNFFFF